MHWGGTPAAGYLHKGWDRSPGPAVTGPVPIPVLSEARPGRGAQVGLHLTGQLQPLRHKWGSPRKTRRQLEGRIDP